MFIISRALVCAVRERGAKLKALTGLRMSVFEWQCQHQLYLDYLHRLNFALIMFALGLGGFSGWLLDRTATSSIAPSHIFVGGHLLLTEVRRSTARFRTLAPCTYVARAVIDIARPRGAGDRCAVPREPWPVRFAAGQGRHRRVHSEGHQNAIQVKDAAVRHARPESAPDVRATTQSREAQTRFRLS